MTRTTISARLRLIVEVVFEGNAKAAAEGTHLKAPAFHRLLTGGIENPRISTISKLSEFLGVPIEYLVGTVSAEEAQGTIDRLPEELWLLRSYYTFRQRRSRDWLATYAQRIRPQKRVDCGDLINLSKVFLFPLDPTSPLKSSIGAALGTLGAHPKVFDSVRQLYKAETALLEQAVETLKKHGGT